LNEITPSPKQTSSTTHHISATQYINFGDKKGEKMLTQRERQDSFKRRPKHFAQSYDPSMYLNYKKQKECYMNQPSDIYFDNSVTADYSDMMTSNHLKNLSTLNEAQMLPYFTNNTSQKNNIPYNPNFYVTHVRNARTPSHSLNAAISAAEEAAYNYHINQYPPLTRLNYNNFSNTPRYLEETSDQQDSYPTGYDYLYEKMLSKSLVDQMNKPFWDNSEQKRQTSRKDNFVNSGGNKMHKIKNRPLPVQRNKSLSDYHPVTKYIIEDEDSYFTMLANRELTSVTNNNSVNVSAPILGGNLKRTTSV
jgi:hypothetical protein